MAAGDITVRMNSETKAFRQGVESGIIKPLEDAEKALDDLGKSKGPADLERDLKGAQDETEQLADETKKTAREIEQSYRDAGRDIKKGIGDGLDDAKSEASQSGREAAASFSGEWSDVGDFLQETMANAFGGFGPLGAAAGIAAAAGLGVVTSTILGQQEAADELKARLGAAYQEAAEEGRTYLDTAQIIAEASDLMFNKDRAAEWKQVQEDAKQLGLDVYDVIAANAGAQDKQREVQDRINTLVAEHNEKLKNNELTYEDMQEDVFDLSNRWRDVIAATEEEAEKARSLSDIQQQAEEDNRAQIERTAAAAQARYEGLAAQYSQGLTLPIKPVLDDRAFRTHMAALQQRAAQGITVNVKPGSGRLWE